MDRDEHQFLARRDGAAEFVQRTLCINCGSSRLAELSSGGFHDSPLRDILANDPWGEDPLPYLTGKRWTYVRCGDCGQAFHRDVLSPEWNEIRFERWMTHEAIQACIQQTQTPAGLMARALHRVEHALRIEALTRELRGDGPLRVLDFGCGYGEFVAMCVQFGFEAWGVDRATAKRLHAKLPVHASIDEFVAAAGAPKLHALTLFETLEHLDDPRGVLEALTRHVLPGGILVLETPDCSGVTTITKEDCWRIQPLDHINGFTPATLASMARRCGYVPIPRPEALVTTSLKRVARTQAKRAARALGLLRPTTQQYFRKV